VPQHSIKFESNFRGLVLNRGQAFRNTSEAREAKDTDFSEIGAIKNRKGFGLINTATIEASAPVDGIKEFIKDQDTKSLIVAHNGTVWSLSGTTFQTIASSQGVFTASVSVDMNQFKDILVVSNGSIKPYKYNGTEFTQAGVSSTTQTLSIATDGAGTLTGTYEYKYAGVNSNLVEGDVGVISASFTAAAEAINVSNIPTSPVSLGVESYNIYRNTAAASGLFLRVTNVTNGTTSFVDNNSDSTLLTAAPTDNETPPFFVKTIVFQNRLWGFTEDSPRLYFSNIDDPETFPSTNFLNVGEGDGTVIKSIIALDNGISIHKNTDNGDGFAFFVFMPTTDPTDWFLQKTDSGYGAVSAESIVAFDRSVGFLNKNGFFAFSRSSAGTNLNLSNIGEAISQSNSIGLGLFGLDDIKTSSAFNATGIVFQRKIYLVF